LRQLKEGSVKIVLNGKKLKGEFALVRTRGMADNSWLLIKHKDKFAAESDITEKDKSVLSGKTLEKVAATSETIWKSNRKATARKTPPTKKSAAKKTAATASKKPAAKQKAATPTKKSAA